MKKINILFLGLAALSMAACSEPDDELTSVDYPRVFSPTGIEKGNTTESSVKVKWNNVKGADGYEYEVFADDNLTFAGTPSVTGTTNETSITIGNLIYDTPYSLRVRALDGENASRNSTWAELFFRTNAQQIFKAIAEEQIADRSVILTWPAGETVTAVKLFDADENLLKEISLTAGEIAAGQLTVVELNPETKYGVKLYNGEKERGSKSFTTIADLGGAILVRPTDNFAEMIAAANDGAVLALFGGEYDLKGGNAEAESKIEIGKSVTIKGIYPTNRPVINGSFTVGSAVAKFTLSNVIVDGAPYTNANLLDITSADANLSEFVLEGSIIRGMEKNFIYNNKSGKIGSILINDCIIDRLENGGGDGFDLRGGTLSVLKVTNSTFSNGIRSLVRCQVADCAITFENCTFYNICTNDDSNNTGLFRVEKSGTSLTLKNILIAKVGPQAATIQNAYSGVFGRADKNKTVATDFSGVCYYGSGNLWTSWHKDDFGTFAKEVDPKFKDEANGDLTITDETLKENKLGDPRWCN